MPFFKFIDYLTFEKNYSDHTVKSYRSDLSSFADFCKEEYRVIEIDRVNYSQIRSWIVMLSESGISNRSINRKISSLNTYFKFLIKIKEIQVNPLAKHKALKVAKKIQVPFSDKEMEQVINLISEDDSFSGIRNRAIVELFYATGIRRSELIALKHKDIDYSKKTIKVLGKRNKERILPLINSVLETLQKYEREKREMGAKEKEYFFITNKGLKIYETFVYRVINSYFGMVSTKVKKSPHMIRHSFATHLLNQGADLNALKELLGHSSLAATEVYTHNDIQQLKNVYTNSHPRNKN
ncbi:MAG: tyrosine-type recombinase/integrase [Flavobacteriaceae bacterium]|nr:tyrosine-type recombinase/integrase [Flavobacteriaceae bacterium]